MTHTGSTGESELRMAKPEVRAASSQEEMTSFDEIYDQPDPRDFFRVLGRWDYQTPQHAQGCSAAWPQPAREPPAPPTR